MAERGGRTGDLERALFGLGTSLEYPPTPAIVPSVASRLSTDRVERPRPPFPGVALWPRRKLVALIALGFLVLAGAAVAARLGLGAIGIRVVPSLPTASPTAVESASALGRRITLQEARQALGFPIVLPLGEEWSQPDAVFLGSSPFGERVTMAWRRLELPPIEGIPWGLLLMELRGDDPFLYKDIAAKELGVEAELRAVTVAGAEGFWITGPHDLVLMTAAGEERLRVTGNVLIWQKEGVTLRLESGLPLEEAIAIAESVS